MIDKISMQRVQLLHPAVRSEGELILQECTQRLNGRAQVRFTYTLRTFDEQAQLYTLGRTVANPEGKSAKKPLGNIVTWAQAGDSFHNYGLAIDVCLIIDGKEASWDVLTDFDGDHVADFREVIEVFAKYGWEWGGNWNKPKTDTPHFQKTFGKSIHVLADLHRAKVFIEGTTYVKFSLLQQAA